MPLCLTAAIVGIGTLICHPDHHEENLLYHFAVGVHEIQNGAWADKSHQVTARVIGAPEFAPCGPTDALLLKGKDWLSLASNPKEAVKSLPTRELSVTAWVRFDELTSRGGIIGYAQSSGNQGKGWLVGYNQDSFLFSLATSGADGRMTHLPATTKIEKGRWYYVAATYDGRNMRLYVNGKLENESSEQSGDIVYPSFGYYAIGGRITFTDKELMEGAIFEVKAYARALAEKEVTQVAAHNNNLIAWAPSPDNDLMFLVKPYLQFGTTDSMTIMCETSRPSVMSVAYAEVQPLENVKVTSEAKAISELTLTGLKPATRYFYQVTCKEDSGRQIHGQINSFQTAPSEDLPWAFAVIGDTQRNPEVTRKCANGAYAKRPNFLLHCGDVVDDGFAKNQWLKDLFEPCSELMANIPTFPVIGNHEKDSHWYYDYFSMPKPEYYYTFRFGNAQFFMIDSNRPMDTGSPQYEWLEKELSASKATWKFTCHHHPCFSCEADDYGDHLKGEKSKSFTYGDTDAQKLVPLYEKYGVDIAFNGHIHMYERTWPILNMAVNQKKGVRYITSGGGGGGLESAAPQRAWFTLHFQRAYHYCYAAIADRTIVFKAYDIDGLLFDQFELTKADDR